MAGRSFLDRVERLGNRLPDPVTLFVLGTAVVMAVSWAGTALDWSIEQRLPMRDATGIVRWEPVHEEETTWVREEIRGRDGKPLVDPETGEARTRIATDPASGEPLSRTTATGPLVRFSVRNLLSSDGLHHMITTAVDNFVRFPPLGVVLVGMLGVGLAERTGLIAAFIRTVLRVVPGSLLSPAVVLMGILSSAALDAGYIVLPPLAAALFRSAGRSPVVGLAAVFAGVAAGFNANFVITSLDPLLAGFATTGARVLDPDYVVSPAANWWFLIASTVLMTLAGWGVTARLERRLADRPVAEGGPAGKTDGGEAAPVSARTARALRLAVATGAAIAVLFALAVWLPGAPLHGPGARFDRWVEAIVPMILVGFAGPALAFGFSAGTLRSDRDVARMLSESIAAMAPIIVLAFVAAQFIEAFRWSGLDRMLAQAGGEMLARSGLARPALLVAFIVLTMGFNLLIGSMSAKYALFAPIFIPMFMMVGVSPELTQAAYRIGDSVSNVITPLNPYMIIVLGFLRDLVPKGGFGTLIALMLPYTVVFAILWSALLVGWILLGVPLGPDGPLQWP